SCYYVNFLYTNWTDDRPRFTVNMTFSNSNGIESITTINEEIKSPVTRMLILQQRNKEKKNIVYNATTRLCDMHSIMNAVPLFKPVKDGILKQSNYSFSCPLNKGVYTMSNMRISPRNPLLSILHQSKGIFVVRGALLEELPNSELHPTIHL
ncbi:GH11716, partial [Drosophila grimshawi]